MVEIILETLPYAKIGVDKEDLTKHMHELWDDEELSSLAERTGLPLAALRNMVWIAFLKSDIVNEDVQGYRQYAAVLRREGFDV